MARYLRRMRSIFEAAGVIFVEENGEGPRKGKSAE